WLYDNSRFLYSELQALPAALKQWRKLPHVQNAQGEIVPRILTFAEMFLDAVEYEFSEQAWTSFVTEFQHLEVLELRELWALDSVMRLVLLQRVRPGAEKLLQNPSDESTALGIFVQSLRNIGQTTWKEIVEPLILFDQLLRQDPAGCYGRMDFASR